jgi:hypothetical protein
LKAEIALNEMLLEPIVFGWYIGIDLRYKEIPMVRDQAMSDEYPAPLRGTYWVVPNQFLEGAG